MQFVAISPEVWTSSVLVPILWQFFHVWRHFCPRQGGTWPNLNVSELPRSNPRFVDVAWSQCGMAVLCCLKIPPKIICSIWLWLKKLVEHCSANDRSWTSTSNLKWAIRRHSWPKVVVQVLARKIGQLWRTRFEKALLVVGSPQRGPTKGVCENRWVQPTWGWQQGPRWTVYLYNYIDYTYIYIYIQYNYI